MRWSYRWVKRGLDVAVALLLLALAAPVLAIVAATVLASMGRPVLFRQSRAGRGGRPFTLVKFRTMRVATSRVDSDAERLTRLGRLLRSTSLDELPTLWNVVRGQMSLVGPRPLLLSYVDRYTPTQARRLDATPGITGLAQVRGRNALSWEEKFAYDVSYVDSRSLALDVRILAETVGCVLRRQGISADAHATAPEFVGAGRVEGALR